jgi:hypothetical protein
VLLSNVLEVDNKKDKIEGLNNEMNDKEKVMRRPKPADAELISLLLPSGKNK